MRSGVARALAHSGCMDVAHHASSDSSHEVSVSTRPLVVTGKLAARRSSSCTGPIRPAAALQACYGADMLPSSVRSTAG